MCLVSLDELTELKNKTPKLEEMFASFKERVDTALDVLSEDKGRWDDVSRNNKLMLQTLFEEFFSPSELELFHEFEASAGKLLLKPLKNKQEDYAFEYILERKAELRLIFLLTANLLKEQRGNESLQRKWFEQASDVKSVSSHELFRRMRVFLGNSTFVSSTRNYLSSSISNETVFSQFINSLNSHPTMLSDLLDLYGRFYEEQSEFAKIQIDEFGYEKVSQRLYESYNTLLYSFVSHNYGFFSDYLYNEESEFHVEGAIHAVQEVVDILKVLEGLGDPIEYLLENSFDVSKKCNSAKVVTGGERERKSRIVKIREAIEFLENFDFSEVEAILEDMKL